MTKIEACEKIVKSNNNRKSEYYVGCRYCPFYNGCNLPPDECVEFAKQYLAEHKTSAADNQEKTYPVEFTEKELRSITENMYDDLDFVFMHIKAELALKKINEPQPGDRCAFWDDDKTFYTVDRLNHIDSDSKYLYDSENNESFKNCAKIKKEAEF